MANRGKHGKQSPASPEDTLAELKIAVREAHEAMCGLRDLINEVKQTIPASVDEVVSKAFETRVNARITELGEFLKAEAVRISKQMAEEAERGREWIMDSMKPVAIIGGRDNPMMVFGRAEADDL